LPLLRCRLKRDVFPRAAAQTRKARIHAARVRLDFSPLIRRQLREHGLRDLAESKEARFAILRERDLTEDLGELARCEPARKIHLEEAILCVREAKPISEISARARNDGRNAERIARDTHRGTEAGYFQRAVELRLRADEQHVQEHEGDDDED